MSAAGGGKALLRIEVVEDRTRTSRPDEGFLRLRRLLLRNHYDDGSVSRPYPCDVASRRDVDAVTVVIHGPVVDGAVEVLLRAGVRAPVWLRREKDIAHGGGPVTTIVETIAGVVEPDDAGPGGVERRAAKEVEEEGGLHVAAGAVRALGGALFPSPGVTDERVHFRRVEADLVPRTQARGDGSVMEEVGEAVVLPLREAIRRCRSGEIPDMKTEVALLRLADALGYVPALDRFVDELPADLAARARELPPLV